MRPTGEQDGFEMDETLASQAATGDAQAFRSLLERHYDRVYRIALGIVRNTAEAEDVTQEVWSALPAKLRNWRGEAKFTSWLHTVTLNASRDALRRAATRGVCGSVRTRSRRSGGYRGAIALAARRARQPQRRFAGNSGHGVGR